MTRPPDQPSDTAPVGRPHAAPLPAAVLWDMDGTIVDTEPYWIAEEHLLVGEAGGRWSDEDALDLVGQDLTTSAQMILDRTPVEGTPEEVVRTLLAGVIRRTREHVPWRPGARELLAQLRALDVPCALVTMSWTELAEVLVAELPAGTFAAVVSGDQVSQGKPHPEAYQEALRRLGVSAAASLAIEDSPAGATSATAAGVPTLVVPHTVAVPDIPGAVHVGSLEGVEVADLGALVASISSELHPEQGVHGLHDQA